ncbi:anti-sigma factor [Parafilimonas sp.]|uniref:anti-sigma factor n=1 Tax=Parafilimonas sp. TaxID=1969739 RepID=UPI003F80640B
MDIKAYIQSGALEQYVLGLASPEEVAELEQLRAEYPELNEAIVQAEKDFENYFQSQKRQPSSHLKAAIETALFKEDDIQLTTITPAEPVQKKTVALWRMLAAASIILLIISAALNFYFYSGYKETKAQYISLLTERNTLQANNASYKQSLQLLGDSAMVKIEMKGTTGREQNFATVLWDKNLKDVYLYSASLSQIPAGKQYQLWAIVDGKPVDAGMVSGCDGICRMPKKIDHAEAFAITLEKEGGSPVPTMNEMYVIGKVKI